MYVKARHQFTSGCGSTGKLPAVGHLSNLIQLRSSFAPLAHEFAHLSNGDMPHKVPVISADDACMTEQYTHSAICRACSS